MNIKSQNKYNIIRQSNIKMTAQNIVNRVGIEQQIRFCCKNIENTVFKRFVGAKKS